MTTQPQNDAHAEPIRSDTERVLHDFVRDAVSHVSEALKDLALEWGMTRDGSAYGIRGQTTIYTFQLHKYWRLAIENG
ncbi:MAG: hypothetical protein ACREX3_17970 [Gammaproteobacteria bacterium]